MSQAVSDTHKGLWYVYNLSFVSEGRWVGQTEGDTQTIWWYVYNLSFVSEGRWVGQTVGDTHTIWWYVYNLSFVSESARVGQAALSDTHEVWYIYYNLYLVIFKFVSLKNTFLVFASQNQLFIKCYTINCFKDLFEKTHFKLFYICKHRRPQTHLNLLQYRSPWQYFYKTKLEDRMQSNYILSYLQFTRK